jgi:hypothetical protein
MGSRFITAVGLFRLADENRQVAWPDIAFRCRWHLYLERLGKGTVHVARSGLDNHTRVRGMRQEQRTPNYTTNVHEVPIARA